jgi:prepilin peptidase CpaA
VVLEEQVMAELVTGALLAIVLFLAVYLDIRTSRVPNWLTLAAMCIGPFVHSLLEGAQGAMFSLSGLGAGLALFFIFYLTGGMGAGDVKLMGAIGAVVGPYGAFMSGILALMLGGIYAVGAMCYQWGAATTARKLVSTAHRIVLVPHIRLGDDLKLPFHLRYALVIASGTLLFRLGLHPFGG